MKSKLIQLFCVILVSCGVISAQFDSGNYTLRSIKVVYTNFLRDSAVVADSGNIGSPFGAGNKVFAYWPNKAAVLALQGYPHELVGGNVADDLVAVFQTDDSLLTYEGMANFGIVLEAFLDYDNNTAIIPPDPLDLSTFPTINLENCVTFPVVAPATDNMINQWTGPIPDDINNPTTLTYGWGIQQSDVFDWFNALPMVDASGNITENLSDAVRLLDPVADAADSWFAELGHQNYGSMVAHINVNDPSKFDTLEIVWHAIDGTWEDGGADAGYEPCTDCPDEGRINRILGVQMKGDLVTIPFIQAVAASYGITINSPTAGVLAIGANGIHPSFGGPGDTDGDGISDDAMGIPGPAIGTVGGYLFDPAGGDGELFSGDEPLQFTGYYFTFNFLQAAAGFQYAFTVAITIDPIDILGALTAGIDSVATYFDLLTAVGGSQATYDAIVNGTAASLFADFGALVAAGMDAAEALETIAPSGPVVALGGMISSVPGLADAINDSDHDYNLTDGRLVFGEIDENPACIPIYQHRDVTAIFVKTEFIAVDSDYSILPDKFVVHDNYPNPFNPSTKISFELPEIMATEISIYNLLGQKIRTLYIGDLKAGYHTITFDGKDTAGRELSSGVYLYRIEAGDQFVVVKKMMLLK
ncbi:MAG: T9SS type A sorting domain-containing protein [Candidatus Marinimicrobia bacterium]|nr:T9SS type A sorting domain-containing protein [Candidatus Neomarinimicrobiota bacterium]